MKIAILKERGANVDPRVFCSPETLLTIVNQHPEISIKLESSSNRFYSDDDYKKTGIEVTDKISDCDVFIALNQIPAEYLIPDKIYILYYDINDQQKSEADYYNDLKQKNISGYNIFRLANENGINVRENTSFASVYNCFRAFGVKFELFKLPKIEYIISKKIAKDYLRKLVLPPLKILVITDKSASSGAQDALQTMKIKEVSQDNFFRKNYTQSVFCSVNPIEAKYDIADLVKMSEMVIVDALSSKLNHEYITQNILKDSNCKIKIVGSLYNQNNHIAACVLRCSTFADPFYGYLANQHKEVDFYHPAAIVVTAVNSLHTIFAQDILNELSDCFLHNILPALLNGEQDRELAKFQINGLDF